MVMTVQLRKALVSCTTISPILLQAYFMILPQPVQMVALEPIFKIDPSAAAAKTITKMVSAGVE